MLSSFLRGEKSRAHDKRLNERITQHEKFKQKWPNMMGKGKE